MSTKIMTQYGNVNVKKANQNGPYRLYKKKFKSKEQKIIIDEFGSIVRRYYSYYSDKEVAKLYEELSKKGCTYATMANLIIEQLNKNNKTFEEYFGYSLKNDSGVINYNKLMIDIYACISEMVEITVNRYNICKFSNVLEAAHNILHNDYTDTSKAILDLFNAGWSSDGLDKRGMLVFKNRFCTNEILIGSYREIAKNLFNIDDVNMNKDCLEELLKESGLGYKFNYLSVQSKFSGLPAVKINNLKKWMNKYFDVNNIPLSLQAEIIQSNSIDYSQFLEDVYSKLKEGYSIEVSTPLKAEVWMSDGREWIKPTDDTAGHQMNFLGFDKEGNILVCSWGTTYMFPKEFYQQLEFIAIKIDDVRKEYKKSI